MRVLAPIYETIRLVKAELPPAVDVSRLLRRAVDGCDLHGRRPRHAGSGAGAAVCLSPSRGVCASDRCSGRGVGRISRFGSSRPASMLCKSSIPGQECCRRTNSRAGALRRRKRIVADVRRAVPGAKIIGFPRGAGSNLKRYVEDIAIDAVGLDWMVDLEFARDEIQRRAAGAGQSRSAGVARRRRGARPRRRCDPGSVRRRAVHFQSRPRHPAGHADRPCRADAQARAWRMR